MMLHTLAVLRSTESLGPSFEYSIRIDFIARTLSGLIAGVVGGSVLILINEKIFRKKSYAYALMATAVFYTLVFLLVSIAVPVTIILMETSGSATLAEVIQTIHEYLLSIWMTIYYFQWGAIALLTLFFLQVSDKFGPGVLSQFLKGKYYQPKEEMRIFMFLDMKSSTTIAEKIGHKKYFNLLNAVFSDITDSILATEGEIYQYVGDEVVVSWKLENGISNANCLRCFANIQKKLREKAGYYQEKYGTAPEFKAGLHNGPVTVGEIGSVKREIVYSGDVLNTTSRIQELCNRYKVDCLISNQALGLLKEENGFEAIQLGDIKLRGKKETIYLNTISELG